MTAAAWWTGAAAVRLGPRLLPTRRPAPGEAMLRAALAAAFLVVAPVAVLGFLGLLSGAALALVAAILYLAARRLPAAVPGAPRPGRLRALGWPAALTGLLAAVDLIAYLPAPPVSWDAMTYHLYFPARWLQEGRLFHIPTVFSDNAAAFAPQNGALFFAWQMGLSARDAVVNVSQLLCLAGLGLVLYRICRRLGTGRQPAVLAALTLAWLAPLRLWTFSANVDVWMAAFWLAALHWQLAYLERPETGTLAASGLAAGLAAGAKTVGLPLVALTALGWAPALLGRRRWSALVLYGLAFIAGGGWWYLRNAWLYGNPLFPLRISLAGFSLPGAYDGAALRAGEFHLADPWAVALEVWRRFGPAAVALMVLGFAVLGAGGLADLRRHRRRRAAAAGFLFAVAVLWAATFAVVVPHNHQTRFLIPTLVLSLAGWARALHWAGRFGALAPRVLWLAGAAGAAASSRPWRAWEGQLAALADGGVDAARWALAAVVAGLLAAAALALRRRVSRGRAPLLGLLAGALVAGLLARAALEADHARRSFLARADFRGWAEGYLPFAGGGPPEPETPPPAIAYTGANVPYALMGPGWRHRVVYVNTQGRAGDGFYDFWRRDRRVHRYHKPGIYRGRDDYGLWLSHLEAERIGLVVIFRLHQAEARYLATTPGGFPVERAWARRHPERFAPVFTGPAAEIYRVLPQAVAPP